MARASLKKVVLAYGLSTLLVLGTVLLPLSHYGWMLLSGRFDQHKEHVAAAAATGPHASETASGPHASETAAGPHAAHQAEGAKAAPIGIGLEIADQIQISCDYSTTVVQNPVVECDSPTVGLYVPPIGLLIESFASATGVRAQHRLPLFRGPPIV